MRILGIESSCDDLAVCLFEGPDHIVSEGVASQEKTHARYGGIVPEIASREHLLSISSLVESVIQKAPEEKRNFDAVAVTSSPGLIGSLLVGLNFAKGLALSRNIPLIGVNHLEGHLMSVFLEDHKPSFPFLGLAISGGHTHFYWVEDFGKKTLVGSTVDDAAGEAYDKVAKLLGLGYPGGPILDRLAKLGDAQAIPFKLPLVKRGKNFTSFSGLKTAVVDYARENKLEEILKKRPIEECPQALNLIASFQKTVAKIVDRLMQHLSASLNAKRWAITGGVACNSEIRSRLGESAKKLGVELFIPRPKFCTDNASMIALVGHAYLSKGLKSDIDLNATATESRMPT